MLFAEPSSGDVNTMITITGIGDHDRPEWMIRISGIRTQLFAEIEMQPIALPDPFD